MSITTWSAAPDSLALTGEQVHIWRIDLAPPSADLLQLRTLLTESERERADRFLAEKHRGRFIVGRARMRQILGKYVEQSPSNVELYFENLGKPYFADPVLHEKFQFNFSNSSNIAICAVTLRQPVGVDVERIRPMSDMLGLARRYFAESETAALFAQVESQQSAAFFRLWTRKEAWLKAIGKGLTFPLRDVEVSFDDIDCRVHSINQDPAAAAKWALIPFFPDEEHVGALAIQRTENEPVFFEFA